MRKFGFSTGALAYSDFNRALEILQQFNFPAVELSALREPELPILLRAISDLNLSAFEYVSFHAPSSIDPQNESDVVEMLLKIADKGWPVIVHPDVIRTSRSWLPFGPLL